ncbi:hypothetical protein ACXHQB_23615 [Vibrio parahaemolyticus]|uniref:hypothetical protein n=1 Tax=Vibrio parahaemolyticus TaxID=670 RepID=UPI001A2F65D4|nr:hypothetical protein [Vibrio parahaemolyticus]MCC3798280.1 hypothetical protein [Vibrio parahaemolyticus]HAS6073671.1 hypothetical protein [Vibrio vulnificus]
MTNNQIIAKTILSQLGGGRFISMTGAKNMVAIENGLQFDLPRTLHYVKDGINKIQVILDPSDTYTVRGLKWMPRKYEFKELASQSGVYGDSLEAVFTDITGLDTHLF